MDLAELDKLKKQREEEHRLDMEALDRVYRMQASVAGESSQNGKAPKRPRKPSQGSLPSVLKNLVGEFGAKEFTVGDLLELLKKNGKAAKRGSVKGVAKMLVKNGVLILVTQGAGRRQSVFKNKA